MTIVTVQQIATGTLADTPFRDLSNALLSDQLHHFYLLLIIAAFNLSVDIKLVIGSAAQWEVELN